jgi:hypothetical protein
MTVLKLHTNTQAITTEDKKLLADFINANMGLFWDYCEEQHSSETQLNRLMTFIEDNAAPFDDNMCDVEI